MLPRGPKKSNSLGAIRKKVYCVESLRFWWKGRNFSFERGEVGPSKKVFILVQRPQHKSISNPVGAPKNNQFGAIFIEFGDTEKCCTFSGLE